MTDVSQIVEALRTMTYVLMISAAGLMVIIGLTGIFICIVLRQLGEAVKDERQRR